MMFYIINLAIGLAFIALVLVLVKLRKKTDEYKTVLAFGAISSILVYTIYNFMLNSIAKTFTDIIAIFTTGSGDVQTSTVGTSDVVSVAISIILIVITVLVLVFLVSSVIKIIKNKQQFLYFILSALLVTYTLQVIPTLLTQAHMLMYVQQNLDLFAQQLANYDAATLESLYGITDPNYPSILGVIRLIASNGTQVAYYTAAYFPLVANVLIQSLVIICLAAGAIFKSKYDKKEEARFLTVFTILFLVLRVVELFVLSTYFPVPTDTEGTGLSWFQTNSNALFDIVIVILIYVVGILFVRTIKKSIDNQDS